MFIFYLIPLALLALPIVAIVVALNHSSRLKALEDSIVELKKKVETGVSSVQKPIAVQPVVSTSPTEQTIEVAPRVAEAAPEKNTPQEAPQITAIHSEDSSGKILGRIGIAAVLIGIAFFLKYAFDNNWIGPAGRVMIGILAGLGFLGMGQYIRAKYLQYSDLIMGGGIAILYLSVFSAHSFYNLIDTGTTGLLMFVVTLLSFAISIVNATQTLALVSVIGAFATPSLVGSHENAMMTLFGYLTLINIGVLGVSFFKKWPRLNLASFIGTAINFLVWFGSFYGPAALAPTLGFCIVTFLIFLIAQLARGIAAGTKADEADYLLIGVNALAFALIGYALLAPDHHGILGFASVLVAGVYMIFAVLVNKANPDDKAINIFLPGLAVTFLSIAVPLQFSGPWIAVAWFIEACVLYGIASVISNRGFQMMGLVVYALGIIDYLVWYAGVNTDLTYVPIFNAPFIVLLLAVIAAYVISFIYYRYGSISAEIRTRGIVAFFIIANVLSLWALTMQITSYYSVASEKLARDYQTTTESISRYSNGYDTQNQMAQQNRSYYDKIAANRNASNTLVSILWTVYAAILTAIGFMRRLASLRRFGLVLFIVTAVKVLIDVWNLGELYRIISFIAFGIIALAASFGYVKYKDRLKQIISLALFIGLSAAASYVIGGIHEADAAFVPSDWAFMRSLSPASSGFSKVVLPADISWTSDSTFADARIIDGRGGEVPYFLSRTQLSTGPLVTARLLNLSSLSDGTTRFVADLGASGIVYSDLSLSIDSASQNFRRQVSVYASDELLPLDSQRWSLITSAGFIYRTTDPSNGFVSGKYTVSFSPSTARYLKVVIGSGSEGSLKLSGVTVERETNIVVGSNTSTVDATIYNDPTKKTTDITIDLGSSGRLSDRVDLSIGGRDANYVRRVVVSASDDQSSWRYVGSGSISRVSTSVFSGASNSVSYPEQRSRYIRLSVVNDDNPPLSIQTDVIVNTSLAVIIFEARAGETYNLYYGNSKALQPEYDTTQLSSYVDQNTLPVITVGPEKNNPAYVPPKGPIVPFTEAHPLLLNTVLVILVIVVGGAVAWYLRSYVIKGSSKKGWDR